jgi:Ca2+:H+ antiporter
MPVWTWVTPLAALALLIASRVTGAGPLLVALCGIGLVGSVIAAVHHAEVVAHRVGEPFGTLVLALAVTAIETSLIVSMMLAGGKESAVLPRDTVYAAVMIICNGVTGLCILMGGLAHREQSFRVEGAGAGLAALIVMTALALMFPVFTTSTPGPGSYSGAQMAFVALSSAVLWGVFVFVQTVRHRDYFIPAVDPADPDVHAEPPTLRETWGSFALLLVSLVVVVGLAKVLSPSIEQAVDAVGAPRAVVGIVIAMLVLLPETWAAVRAARANRLQTSLNLAIGSAVACIGLTIPAVIMAAIVLDLPLVLGLEPKDMLMLGLTFLVSVITLGTGRTYIMQGAVHLVIFAAFMFLAFVP